MPESRQDFPGAGEKDELESYLHAQVCSNKIPLATAQRAVATDWPAAYCAARLAECADGVHLVPSTVRPRPAGG